MPNMDVMVLEVSSSVRLGQEADPCASSSMAWKVFQKRSPPGGVGFRVTPPTPGRGADEPESVVSVSHLSRMGASYSNGLSSVRSPSSPCRASPRDICGLAASYGVWPVAAEGVA